MSDLFHTDVPLGFIQRTFDVMRRAHWHTFQVLPKRAARLAQVDPAYEWPDNVWMGVSVENEAYTGRIDELCTTPARVKFPSLEPLLGPLPDMNLEGIDWVIVVGESGPGARSMERAWVLEIRRQCQRARVPFFFKQWGGVFKSRAGRELDGRTWDELPRTYRPVPAAS